MNSENILSDKNENANKKEQENQAKNQSGSQDYVSGDAAGSSSSHQFHKSRGDKKQK